MRMQMGSDTKNHITDFAFTLALFCVFTITALLVVLIGANVYKKSIQQTDDTFVRRTSLTYVATKIRQHDAAGAIHVQELDGVSALVLEQEITGETLQTWIYFHDGALRELLVTEGAEIDKQSGQSILELRDFYVQQADGSLQLTAVNEAGQLSSQWVTPRCGLA